MSWVNRRDWPDRNPSPRHTFSPHFRPFCLRRSPAADDRAKNPIAESRKIVLFVTNGTNACRTTACEASKSSPSGAPSAYDGPLVSVFATTSGNISNWVPKTRFRVARQRFTSEMESYKTGVSSVLWGKWAAKKMGNGPSRRAPAGGVESNSIRGGVVDCAWIASMVLRIRSLA